MNKAIVAAVCGVAVAAGSQAMAQMPPSYGFEFATITHAGNRPANAAEAPEFPYFPLGSVGYEYRISRTEVTVGQWIEFCTAYGRWVPPEQQFEMTGRFVFRDPGTGVYSGRPDLPAEMGWRFAARYCNWLHNGKVNERWAFESGAYDTSTFLTLPNGTFTDQLTPTPGARFWIPSLDEWIKAAHYDPNRYGPGVEGYWLYGNGSNTPSRPGLPSEGGETLAGLRPSGSLPFLPVKSFPHVQSPWGLWDVSGGVSEWTGTAVERYARYGKGTASYSFLSWPDEDRLDNMGPTNSPVQAVNGFRIASSVPSIGTVAPIVLVFPGWLRQRRREA